MTKCTTKHRKRTAVKDIYNENTIKEAIEELGSDKSYYTRPVKEFLH